MITFLKGTKMPWYGSLKWKSSIIQRNKYFLNKSKSKFNFKTDTSATKSEEWKKGNEGTSLSKNKIKTEKILYFVSWFYSWQKYFLFCSLFNPFFLWNKSRLVKTETKPAILPDKFIVCCAIVQIQKIVLFLNSSWFRFWFFSLT